MTQIIRNTTILLVLLFIMTNVSFGQNSDTTLYNNQNIDSNITEYCDSATVYVSFNVDTSGNISNIKVIKVECKNRSKQNIKSYKSEAIRILKEMPAFEPRAEKVKFILPIKFKIKK